MIKLPVPLVLALALGDVHMIGPARRLTRRCIQVTAPGAPGPWQPWPGRWHIRTRASGRLKRKLQVAGMLVVASDSERQSGSS